MILAVVLFYGYTTRKEEYTVTYDSYTATTGSISNALSFDMRNSAYVWMHDDAGELVQVPVEVGVSNGNYV